MTLPTKPASASGSGAVEQTIDALLPAGPPAPLVDQVNVAGTVLAGPDTGDSDTAGGAPIPLVYLPDGTVVDETSGEVVDAPSPEAPARPSLAKRIDTVEKKMELLAGEFTTLADTNETLWERFTHLDARFPLAGKTPFQEWLTAFAQIYYLTADEIAEISDPGAPTFNTALFGEFHALWGYYQDAFGKKGSGQQRCNWHDQVCQVLARRGFWQTRRENAGMVANPSVGGWNFTEDDDETAAGDVSQAESA